MQKTKIIIIGGATASGKTGLSIELAKRLGGEVVSADSMQIYKYMNIGSAKPTHEEMQGIQHHMIDVVEPSQNFSVADYSAAAKECIADIAARGKLPIVCGGTGLYIESIINDIDFDDTTSDEAYRAELSAFASEFGNPALYERLVAVDPEAALKIHANNVKRVIRALEYYHTTGTKISDFQKGTKQKESTYDYKLITIEHDRAKLYERINKRVDIMMEQGLINEVQDLLSNHNVSATNTSMQAIGYKELVGYLNGEDTLDNAIEIIKQESRRYAKRQLTWFRRYPDLIQIPYGAGIIDKAIELSR